MTTLTKATNPQLQQAQRERTENRQGSDPITPYRRGFEDCFYARHYANPYQIGRDDAINYHWGFGDARLIHYLNRTCLRDDETDTVDRLLVERGRTAQVERVCLQTGAVVKRFAIGQKASKETELLR
jgi:hypothetical protein